MNGKQQHLYYTLGQLAYAFARTDGQLNKSEKEKLCKIFTDEVQKSEVAFDLSDIIFRIVEKEKKDFESTYNWAILSFKLGRENISQEIKKQFLYIIKKVVETFPRGDNRQQEFIKRFEKDLAAI